MSQLEFTYDWMGTANDELEYTGTSAMFTLRVGTVNLTRNEDIWSKSIRDSVLVSMYPLAMWLASSWWRLNWEPLPAHGVKPDIDWRMAHELGAANHGYVWPQVAFASDTEVMQIWAAPSRSIREQSVKYINGLDTPISVTLLEYQRTVDDFINVVLERLDAISCKNTDLSNLWQIIQEDRADPQKEKYRRREAEMGYDPDVGPEQLINHALSLEMRVGPNSLSELIPVYGTQSHKGSLSAVDEIADASGLTGAPQDPRSSPPKTLPAGAPPWKRAVAAADDVRKALNNQAGLIDDKVLYDLLGLDASTIESWSPEKLSSVAVAIPQSNDHYTFIPRKRHPIGKRFELARFLGDYILTKQSKDQWLTSTDLSTSRQKFQRAFAAEFLCPIDALVDFLSGDYSESAIEEAAQHFQVSPTTVDSLLANNGYVHPIISGSLPYSLSL